MTEQNKPKKRSIMGLILGFFIISSLTAAAYTSWQNIVTEKEIESANQKLETQELALKKLLENEQVGEKTKAKKILNKAAGQRIEWSMVAARILTEVESEEIELERVSSTSNLYFTSSGKAKDLRAIARLIAKMRQSEHFNDPFVSGFSQNGTSDKPYSFNLTFYYQK